MVDAIERIGQAGVGLARVDRHDQASLVAEADDRLVVALVSVVSQDEGQIADDPGKVALQ